MLNQFIDVLIDVNHASSEQVSTNEFIVVGLIKTWNDQVNQIRSGYSWLGSVCFLLKNINTYVRLCRVGIAEEYVCLYECE